jgi:alpha-beta hydrolase superfamily lysophospholipase
MSTHHPFPAATLALIALAVVATAPAFPGSPATPTKVVCPRMDGGDNLHTFQERQHERNPGLKTAFLDFGEQMRIRVGIQDPPSGQPRADVLYLHGYSDRIDNHRALFERWNRDGFRVIAYELPGHGPHLGDRNDINAWSFEQIAEMGAAVEGCVPSSRPLFVSGWSTGGLLTIRRLQGDHGFPRFTRPVAGAVAFAPGVALRKIPGDKLRVTLETLTPDPEMQKSIQPPYPNHMITSWRNLLQPVTNRFSGFPGQITEESKCSWKTTLPIEVPTLVLIGGDASDRYADASRVIEWIRDQEARQKKEHGRTTLVGVECQDGYHALDLERPEIGERVRDAAALFFSGILSRHGLPDPAELGLGGPCRVL